MECVSPDLHLRLMMSPQPELPPGHFLNPAPQLRTFPFAPFGFEQPPGPQQQFQSRQALGARGSNAQFMPAVRSADCVDNIQQPGPAMRASSSSFDSTQQQQDVKELTKQCAEQEKEIKEKKEEISQLKKQLEKMSQSAKESSSTTVEQKTVTTKSAQGQTMDKEMKTLDKDFDDGARQNSDMAGRKKKK
uniref:Uncharacterized protein n=2 Tax=Lygus hesperus TaxID=30085 RepID=A0A0K8SH83_LYGHE